MILLDTNAVIWLETGHPRAKPLSKVRSRLFVSPATVLEVQFLLELGRIRLRGVNSAADLVDDDPRWIVDDPPARDWFEEATALSWTRDPFDRLIVAHARARNWKLATADGRILEHLEAGEILAL